jgi:hypothetical protein
MSTSVAQALEGNATLSGLLAGHRRAQACFSAVAPCLAPPLRSQLRPGPIDGASWTILATNNAAAAKLRQSVPMLLSALLAHGESIAEIRIKVSPKSAIP